jgi:hypothetical protein
VMEQWMLSRVTAEEVPEVGGETELTEWRTWL